LDNTVMAGGMGMVYPGAHVTGTTLIGGEEAVFGTETGAFITSDGRMGVFAGGATSGVTVNAGLLYVFSGGETVSSLLAGSAGGGEEYVAPGGIAYGTTVSALGSLYVIAGGEAVNTTVGPTVGGNFAYFYVNGIASGTLDNGGTVVIDGGSASATTITGG